ncbi:MAG TPA: sialidase family protein [Gemmatimonadales bacterium]|nr:sialidase family protein [Gemmatimonadales bacterium]
MLASADPSIARDPASGDLLLTWVGDDGTGWRLYFARSADQGEHWSEPVRVTADTGEVRPHGEASPRLVAGPAEKLAVIWPRELTVPGRQWPASAIRVAHSVDGGRRWLGPRTINDDTLAASVGHNFQGAAWSGDSGLVAAWLDERNGELTAHHHDRLATAGDSTSEPDATVYLARSPDFGRTWERNEPVWGGACPCCRITLARDEDGRVTAAWRQHFPGNVRDVVIGSVAPATEAPVRVSQDGWVYPGCPHNGPGIAIGADRRRHVVWYTGAAGRPGLYYAALANDGRRLGTPLALVAGSRLPAVHGSIVALAGGGALAAFDAAPDGRRAIGVAELAVDGRVSGHSMLRDSDGGVYPQLATVSARAVVVAYTAPVGERREVRLARVALPEADH